MSERLPAVAGAFYQGTPEALREQVKHCFDANPAAEVRTRFIAAVVPHAGLMYSGHVAAALYAGLEFPPLLILLGPNHTGFGRPVAIDSHDAWRTPLGSVPVAASLRDELLAESDAFELDPGAHRHEHSLEVQLPFIPDGVSIVPICLGDHSFAICEEVGEAIARVMLRRAAGVGIIASSDLSHYHDQTTALRLDERAIDRILALDPAGLHERIEREDISMCGYLPVTAAMIAARALGASRVTLIKHATSGDVSGDYRSVVGYASILIQ